MNTTDSKLLAAAALRARMRPGLIAHDLDRFWTLVGEEPTTWIGVGEAEVNRLALCRTPRRGTHFAQDVLEVAHHVGVDPVRLAGLVRLVDVLPELHESTRTAVRGSEPTSTSLLTAARDDADEHTVLTDSRASGPGLPGWLHEAVERFWRFTPPMTRYPRDLDFAILVGLPLAMVELPHLSVRTVAEWLEARNIDLDLRNDRRLRACLVALGGVGLVFVDAQDDATQRRVSLAHEAAHFVVEYLVPRQEVARHRPDLLDVLDGQRVPSPAERLSAVLGDVPIGVHTHLIGQAETSDRVDSAEWRARRVAVELLAPLDLVLQRMSEENIDELSPARNLLVEEFGLPVSLADDYAEQLTLARRASRPGFLEAFANHDPAEPSAIDTPNRISEAEPEDRDE